MAIPIAPVQFRWPLPSLAETVTSDHASAACYRFREDFRIVAVVVSELKFRNVQRHIFGAHFVECADHTALEDRPEAFDGLSMDCTNNIFAPGMVHSGVREIFAETLVAGPLISAEQADFCEKPSRGRRLPAKRLGRLRQRAQQHCPYG